MKRVAFFIQKTWKTTQPGVRQWLFRGSFSLKVMLKQSNGLKLYPMRHQHEKHAGGCQIGATLKQKVDQPMLIGAKAFHVKQHNLPSIDLSPDSARHHD
ncbi:hypothetical protein [Lacticaseibacillus suibinensis]|uniref:hypothetical protein n=1 Tax=Lacticaseibacillus suibinensis TaxID=2486011 RepID=UPI001944256F|nr:hypothetical protein [Lacticaseibacillus suibinensis]